MTMRWAARIAMLYLGLEILIQPTLWMMSGDRIDYVSHTVVYGAVAPVIVIAGVGVALFGLFAFI